MMMDAEKTMPATSTANSARPGASPFDSFFNSSSFFSSIHSNDRDESYYPTPTPSDLFGQATSSGHGSGESSPASEKGDREDGSEGIPGSGSSGGTGNEGLDDIEEEMPNRCRLCQKAFNQPKVLSCLHVFCQSCLEQHAKIRHDLPVPSEVIACPSCQHPTRIPEKGIAFLVPDYILVNQLEQEAIEGDTQLPCESCKYNRQAVARCLDCCCYVCSDCFNAHDYMKCFENHKVVTFEELKKQQMQKKYPTCLHHTNHELKYFCKLCQIPVCEHCYTTSHSLSPHNCHVIGQETIDEQREDLLNLAKKAAEQVTECRDVVESLTTSLQDLSSQCEQAKDQVEETYHSLKSGLEKWKEDKLKEIDDIRKKQDLGIMDVCSKYENTADAIESALTFKDRLFKEGGAADFLCLKKVLGTRLLDLIQQLPRKEFEPRVDFMSNVEEFEMFLKRFGKFYVKSIEEETSASVSGPMGSMNIDADSLSLSLLTDPSVVPPLGSDMVLPPVSDFLDFQFTTSGPMPPVSSGTTMDYPSVFLPPSRVDMMSSNGGVRMSQARTPSDSSTDPFITTVNGSPASAMPPPPIRQFSQPDLMNMGRVPSPNLMEGRNAGSTSPASSGSSGMRPLPPMGFNEMPPSLPVIPPLLPGNTSGSITPTYPPRRQNVEAVHTKYRFGSLGSHQGQFSSPHGFCLGADEEIIIADTNNHRIQVFQKDGTFKFQFGNPGREEGQLWYPRKVTVLRHSNRFVICDRGNERSRMQIFTKTGHFVRKIAIRYIDIVAGVCSTPQDYIVAVDSVSPTVFCIKDTGELYHWFDCSENMREPSDIAVLEREYYICDFKGHCVCVFTQDGSFINRIGGDSITNFPNGIDISDNSDIVVGDSHGNRFHLAVFRRDGTLLGEYECPNVKVSRCCGLKITSEGYVVTLAKNNHHVLVLNSMLLLQQR